MKLPSDTTSIRSLFTSAVPDGLNGVTVIPTSPTNSERLTEDTYPKSVDVRSLKIRCLNNPRSMPIDLNRINPAMTATINAIEILNDICPRSYPDINKEAIIAPTPRSQSTPPAKSKEHTSELQSRGQLVC